MSLNSEKERAVRALWIRALARLNRDISYPDSDDRIDEDGMCELVWLSSDDEIAEDIVADHLKMCKFLEEHGVRHSNESDGPEFLGYSEYTPDPGWVMRIRVSLVNTFKFSELLCLAKNLVETQDSLKNWSRLAYDYSAELKSYVGLVHRFSDHECSSDACVVVRSRYEASPDIYDKRPSEFPYRANSAVSSTLKAIFPERKITELAGFVVPTFSRKEKDDK